MDLQRPVALACLSAALIILGGAVLAQRSATAQPSAATLTLRVGPLSGLTAGAGAIWVIRTQTRQSSVLRIDPKSGKTLEVAKLNGSPGQVLYADRALWIVGGSGPGAGPPGSHDFLLEVGPTTGRT